MTPPHIHPSWLARRSPDEEFRLAWDHLPRGQRETLLAQAAGQSREEAAKAAGLCYEAVLHRTQQALKALPGLDRLPPTGRVTRVCYLIGKLGLEA